jgi:signal transduction histidine kinase
VTPQPPPAPADSLWVEGELVRSLMRSQRATRWLSLLLVPVMASMLWGEVPQHALLAWAFASIALAAGRFVLLRHYESRIAGGPAEAQIAFLQRWRFAWPLTAMLWGSSALLFFDRAPLETQFVCWLLLSALGMFSINTLSAHLATLHAFMDTLAVTTLAVILWRLVGELHFGGPAPHHWMVVIALVFWPVLRQVGERQHATLRRNYELQYRNEQLIESLTRQTQAALEAVAIKNRFLASAAHDIRQPVHALGLYADWLGSEPEMVHQIAPKIVESTKAVNALFDSLFDLARLDSGKVRLHVEELRLDKLLHHLELQYRPIAQSKGLQFRVHAVAGTVVSDPILLQRIIGNLIANALKYTQQGGVLVAARMSGATPRIEIWDTGMGIAPEHQGEIFREFYKVPAHAGTEDGFGLGLYIVARLAHILGHPLAVSSRPGRGSVFRLLVQPTDPQEAARRAVSSIEQLRADAHAPAPAVASQ